jgi:ribose/xylose/arabinose/galactoside ABC-type transport system permease subunit
MPALKDTKVVRPEAYRGSAFLSVNNLLNVSNQIAVIAILAIGMTLVIITGGIDLSVGSLIALAAVACAWLIWMAGEEGYDPAFNVAALFWVIPLGACGAAALAASWRRHGGVARALATVALGGGVLLLLYALAPVAVAPLVQALQAFGQTPAVMLVSCLLAIALCGLVGVFSGSLVAFFRVPPFIVTLAVMFLASGLAFKISAGQTISKIPESFQWLGRGADVLNIPNAVLLMAVLYVLAHVLMTRTALGRYVYAVGGNAEAARLSGVPVRGVVVFAYAASGALAGLGGVIVASQFKSAAATYGATDELYVIAAAVVGGCSLAGGEGRIFGTLIGAFIIGVIRNGMNLLGLTDFDQRIVLGLIILAAVLFDMIKRRDESEH